jgi:arylsulfatase A-like enzyme
MLFEGGIRVPFCVSWPARIRGGRTMNAPITALDIFPTVLAAAGIASPDGLVLDGVNLLPVLAEPGREPPRHTLVWRYAAGPDEFGYAVRDGRFKLVSSVYKGRKLLFDAEVDPYEQRDLAVDHSEIVRRLTDEYDRWARGMMPPRWLDPHGANVRKEEAARQAAVDAASRGERSAEASANKSP